MGKAPQGSALSWTDAPMRRLLTLSWPITLSTISYAVYTVVDTWFVSHLGSEALAAASMGGVFCFSVIWFNRGVLASVKLKVSQERGANSDSDPDLWILPGLKLAMMLGLASLAALTGLALLVVHFTETPGAGQGARDYILLRGSGIFFTLLAATFREALFGESESRIPLWGSVASTGANIGLDALFIFGLGWSVQGAAFATALAYGVDLLVLWRLDARRRRQLGRPPLRWSPLASSPRSHEPIQTLWRLGWPIGVANFMEVGAFCLLTIIVAKVGNMALAAHQIVLQVMHFAFLPVIAIGEAASIMVSEAFGAGQRQWLLPLTYRATAIVLTIGAIGMLVIWLWAPAIAQFFAGEPDFHALMVRLFYIAALFQLGDGFNIVSRSVLRGIQDIRFVSTVTIGATWMVTCPLAYWLVLQLRMGAPGAWWSILTEVFLVAGILWVRLVWSARADHPVATS